MEKPKKLSLKTEIENEARQIEKELAEHPELDELEVTEEMDHALWAKIQAYEHEKAIEEEENQNLEIAEELMPDISCIADRIGESVSEYHADSDNSPKESASKIQKENTGKQYARKRGLRLWIALAAVLVLVMGLGVTSMGSKSYWKILFERIVGKAPVQMTNVEDMDSKETEEKSELDAYKEIEDTLKISIVRVGYKPQDLKFDNWIIEEDIQQAHLFYKYKGEIICYWVYMNNTDSSRGETTEDEKISEYIITVGDKEIQMEEYKVPNSDLNRQVAEFLYKGVHYNLKGVMEKEEFQKIVKNLYFY